MLLGVIFSLDFLNIFLKLVSGPHDLVATSHAAQFEIHTYPEHTPAEFTTRVLFFQCYYIVDADVHIILPKKHTSR